MGALPWDVPSNRQTSLPVAELIIGAQEQALSIKSVEVGVYHTRQDQRCRLGKDAPETALSSRV